MGCPARVYTHWLTPLSPVPREAEEDATEMGLPGGAAEPISQVNSLALVQ